MSKISILKYNDDNHDERVWINGEYAGTITETSRIIEKVFEMIKNQSLDINDLTLDDESTIFAYGDFDSVSEDDAEFIWDWFDNVEHMSDAQIKAIKLQDWKSLLDII